MNRYLEPPSATRADLQIAITADDPEQICECLIGLALGGEDPAWLTTVSIDLLRHPSTEVRRAAVTTLGHVARIHRTIDKERVVRHLESMADDPELSGPASDALDDIAMFVSS
ncbi:hypothetical protein [Nocardioides hwasunensis]|uniref:HEAT repeat domain-containing protein n=1 Tax=Nocardioides hwasunensis TaxID=397258 RepID=A0ABR8MGX0_9ACTN|nr:hypothetical protein [Nocardioides hwasunensis]MBD3915320.1 hypothetical protein [Nocardioides hwasunensis]